MENVMVNVENQKKEIDAGKNIRWKKRHPHLWRMILLCAVAVSAWLLGQLLGPVFVKGLFL